MPSDTPLTIVIVDTSDNVEEKLRPIRGTGGDALVIFPHKLSIDDHQLRPLFIALRALNQKRSLTLATKNTHIRKLAEKSGWQTIKTIRALQPLLVGRPEQDEALRAFSPRFWHSYIRSHLQSIGLISLPNIRIWVLLGISFGVFLFIVFRILPSATVSIWPAEGTVSQTVNVYLVSSGAVSIPIERVRTIPLLPLTVKVDRNMTFDGIGKQFTGKNAEVIMTVYNDSNEQYALRKGTRFVNQAGMVFRLKADISVKSKGKVRAKTVADERDEYGEIIGARGNVPAGIKWVIPALPKEFQQFIYGRNEKIGVGGATSYMSVLKKEDLDAAKKKLEQDLTVAARQLVVDERTHLNQKHGGSFVELSYEELTRSNFTNISLPDEFVGQEVRSVPVSGTIFYTVLLYDEKEMFDLLKDELHDTVGAEKVIVPSSIRKENLTLHVIDAPWDAPIIDWVKVTVDLTGTERYVLDPLTPAGALFSKRIRDSILGKNVNDAERIIKNFPEVSKVSISIWPPWNRTLPSLGSSISLREGE